MSQLKIIVAPDPRLKRNANPVVNVDSVVQKLMDDMLETMYMANGIGLAAPQVGILDRVIVIDIANKKGGEKPCPILMANPEIIGIADEDDTHEEGCLSFPSYFANVSRPKWIHVRYVDQKNRRQELRAEGLTAVCLQHEMDHLDGILFIDYLSSLKRNMIIRKLVKFKRKNVHA
ncbi:MAG: Peptide deformylase [Alphaproteobacteria bacterium MarineAlpha3_Bin5]|nr:MAG: Peptide deformylase [Alphaproteobacteria bacterium MarineAlpha3_Bin5]